MPVESLPGVTTSPSRAAAKRGTCYQAGMANLATVELKAFVPARDFALSKRFYTDLGFMLAWSDDDLAYFHHGTVSFLLQNLYVEAHAKNFMMHLLVDDVDAWRRQIDDAGLVTEYGVQVSAVELRPWRMRDFVLFDPTGVLWRIAQNVS